MKDRVIIWNAHWLTKGGGEKYAATLGAKLAEAGYRVTFAGTGTINFEALFHFFGIDRFDYSFLKISSEAEIMQVAQNYEIFINASFGSGLHAPIPKSIYICHFPTLSRRGRLGLLMRKIVKKNVTVNNLHGQIMNPQFKNVLISNEECIISIEENSTLKLVALENKVRVVKGGVEEHLSKNQIKNLIGPGIYRVGGKQSCQFSYRIDGIEAKSRVLALLSRYFPTYASVESYAQIWANSNYTKGWVDRIWGVESAVIYPPVVLNDGENSKEPNLNILNVGRFMSRRNNHSKNQIEVVKALKKLNRLNNEYSLNLVGGTSKDESAYFQKVKKVAKGHNIRIYPDASHEKLEELYESSGIFWHAAGLGQPLRKGANFEHFGIALVEAMSYGLVPFVYAIGGPAEILQDFPQLLFKNINELVFKTNSLTQNDIFYLSRKMMELSKQYSPEVFSANVLSMLEKL
jgi:glycosyltransferase involved in cell wall biosynthesis